MRSSCVRWVLAFACLVLLSAMAQAATITEYTSASAFSNASTGITLIDFPGPGPAYYNNSSGYTNNGVNFVGYDSGIFQLVLGDPTTILGAPHNLAWGFNIAKGGNSTPAGSYIQINLPAAVTAASLYLATYWEGGTTQVSIGTGNTTIFTSSVISTPTVPPAVFYGITSDTSFSWIRIFSPSGSQPVIGKFQYGDASTISQTNTPEALPMLMIGSGLLILPLWRRFRPAAAA